MTMDSISNICTSMDQSPTIQVKPSFYFMKVLIKNCLEYALQKKGPAAKMYFELIDKLLCSTDVYL